MEQQSAVVQVRGSEVAALVGYEPLARSFRSGAKQRIGHFPISGAKLMTEVVGQDRLFTIESEDPAAVATAHEELRARLNGAGRRDQPAVILE